MKRSEVILSSELDPILADADSALISKLLEKSQQSDLLYSPYALAWAFWLAHSRANGTLKSDQSALVYGYMWETFAMWSAEQGIAINAITDEGLSAFLASLGNISTAHKNRYCSLIQNILLALKANLSEEQQASFQSTLAVRQVFLRFPEYQSATGSSSERIPEYLSLADQAKLILHARQVVHSASAYSLKEARDCALVAFILGTGASPIEARTASLDTLVFEKGEASGTRRITKVKFKGSTNTLAREAPMTRWAKVIVGHWAVLHQRHDLPHEHLFAYKKSEGLSSVQLGRVVSSVFERAGVTSKKSGGFVLRHSFVVRQMLKGTSEDQIGAWIGLRHGDTLVRYKRLVVQEAIVA